MSANNNHKYTYDAWFEYGLLHGWVREKDRNMAISRNKEMGVAVRKCWELFNREIFKPKHSKTEDKNAD